MPSTPASISTPRYGSMSADESRDRLHMTIDIGVFAKPLSSQQNKTGVRLYLRFGRYLEERISSCNWKQRGSIFSWQHRSALRMVHSIKPTMLSRASMMATWWGLVKLHPLLSMGSHRRASWPVWTILPDRLVMTHLHWKQAWTHSTTLSWVTRQPKRL